MIGEDRGQVEWWSGRRHNMLKRCRSNAWKGREAIWQKHCLVENEKVTGRVVQRD